MRADAAKGSYLALAARVKIEQVTELRAARVLLGVAIRRALNKQAREARE